MCDFSCIWECDPKQIYRSERIQTISSPTLETKATTKNGWHMLTAQRHSVENRSPKPELNYY